MPDRSDFWRTLLLRGRFAEVQREGRLSKGKWAPFLLRNVTLALLGTMLLMGLGSSFDRAFSASMSSEIQSLPSDGDTSSRLAGIVSVDERQIQRAAGAMPPSGSSDAGMEAADPGSGAALQIDPSVVNISVPEWGRRVETVTLHNEGDSEMSWSIQLGGSELEEESQKATLRDTTDREGLRKAVQEEGSVRVIVRLDVPFEVEERLDPIAKQNQRQRIDTAQNAVLAEISDHATSVWQSRYTPVLAVEVDGEGLERLFESDVVKKVQEDVAEEPHLPTSTELVGATEAWATGYAGEGQVVAVLDSGTDAGHPFLRDNVVGEACFSTSSTSRNTDTLCPAGTEEQVGEGAACDTDLIGSLLGDACGHGTHVAGIVGGRNDSEAGVAPETGLLPVQVFTMFNDDDDCDGDAPCTSAFRSDIIKGLEHVYGLRDEFDIAAVNMSFGGGRHTAPCDDDPRQPILDQLRAADIAPISSSGNDGYTDAMSAPACVSSVIAVGSTQDGSQGTIADEVSSFSNSTDMLDFWAPGEPIESSVPVGTFTVRGGTSMASPHVAGAWSVLRSKWEEATVEEIKARLTTTGNPITDPRSGLTRPRIQVDAAIDEETWLTVAPLSGTIEPGDQQDITVAVNATSLSPGVYEETLTVTSDGSVEEVALTLEVTEQERAEALVSPEEYTEDVRTGDRLELAQAITNRSDSGGEVLEVEMGIPDFLTLEQVEGEGVRFEGAALEVDPQATADLTFSFEEAVEELTVFEGDIVLNTNDPRMEEKSIPIAISVRTPRIAVGTEALIFSGVAPGDHATLPLEIENTGSYVLTGNVQMVQGGMHFTLPEGEASYEIQPGDAETIEVSGTPLEDGAYEGTIEVVHDAPNQESPIPVALELVPAEVVLNPNYPNPFRAETTVEYSLPEPSEVRLEVFDIQGRHIATLERGEKEAGLHRVRWGQSMGSLGGASGVYFVRLRSDGEVVGTERMTRVQ